MEYNPTIYEINTRVWIRKFDNINSNRKSNDSASKVKLQETNFKNIPFSYWEHLKKLGIDYVWLMGVWKTCPSTIEKYCFEEDLKNSYTRALKDWKKEDIAGSPFAIDKYEINPLLGSKEDLLELKKALNKAGLKLILDFVANHFSVDSYLTIEKPWLFLKATENNFQNDPHTFFKAHDGSIYAHGRDPFFPAWQDTIQVNYFNSDARRFMIDTLIDLTKICDGVRCDMAILALNNVFSNTWAGVIEEKNKNSYEEFWKEAIDKTKKVRRDFLFIAEAYWDLEWQLQNLGFDYTYDKKLTDRLKIGDVSEIYGHLLADRDYQLKSVRFIENHDEERAVTALGRERSKAAAVIISTIQGMRFYYDGQFEGKKIKLPVQLNREPVEEIDLSLKQFYEKLLLITKEEIFRKGSWKILTPISSWDGNESYKNILAWEWKRNNDNRLVVVNYSNVTSTCRIKLDVKGFPEEFIITDLLNDQNYTRSAEEVYHSGLYIELKPFHSHIFSY
ncbi:alpha-amylase family glycosyl hydrolase [Melioribacteraceae bacterium 4301-Me]|uniref:alpha-amylase family glycosyl hydrolase n=1 Tax=Pyranulibacter aquaticus TaxID=3163344 RepID=UPI00359A9D40